MKNTHRLVGSLFLLALASVTSVPADSYLAPPKSSFLVLSNVSGTLRVLDSKGLVLEENHVYLPRIALTNLSPAQLQTLLETKTAYDALTAFGSVQGTNAQSVVVENQLQQTWHQGQSLAERIQTRLEILEDMRAYNNEIALVPGSLAAADQSAVNGLAFNDRLNNRAATVVVAAARVEEVERYKAAGAANTEPAARQAQENYRESAVRVDAATAQAMTANGQITGANQQVTDNLAKCAAMSTRLASHGINVAAAPPFYSIPALTLQTEVNAERKTK